MKYKKKIDHVETPEQFREYISSKNPKAKRMLEAYDDLTKEMKVNFGSDDEETYFFLDNIDREPEVSGISQRELYLSASKKRGDWGSVHIDTGYFKITENGEVSPSNVAKNLGCSLDDWQYQGIDGLKNLLLEVYKAVKIYDKVFPPVGRPKKKK